MLFKKIIISTLALLIIIAPNLASAVPNMSARLSGRVLLQVQAHGEAWYVYPVNQKRYFLGRAHDAAKVIKALGLGVKNKDLDTWKGRAPQRLSGRILLKVEDKGQAFYVYPVDLKIYPLGDPESAFNTLRKFGLGVSNVHLAQIAPEFNLTKPQSSTTPSSALPVNPGTPTTSPAVPATGKDVFKWRYRGNDYQIALNLSSNVHEAYKSSPKSYKYSGTLPDNWHDDYYKMFLTAKSSDTTIKQIADQFKALATVNKLSEDAMIDLMMAFVQSIPYDSSKNLDNVSPNYPYETLYRRLGVCSDKTFLAVMILRELGYGAAVLDYPDVNHSAVGIQCPKTYAVPGTEYCFAETTNYFPIGVVPQSFGTNGVVPNGSAESFKGQFSNVFRISHLGKLELYQGTKGKTYQGVANTYLNVEKLLLLEKDLNSSRPELDGLKAPLANILTEVQNLKQRMDSAKATGDISSYNSLVPQYNNKVLEYNNAYGVYKVKSDLYNSKVSQYNKMVADFYPNK